MIRFYLIALLWFRLFLRLLNKIFIYFFQTENTSKWVTSLPISITFVSNSSKTRCERRLKITVQSSALLFGSFWPREKITFASKFPTEAEERHLKNAADGLITCIQQLLPHQRFLMLTFLHIKTLNAWSTKKWRKKAWILLLETDKKFSDRWCSNRSACRIRIWHPPLQTLRAIFGRRSDVAKRRGIRYWRVHLS